MVSYRYVLIIEPDIHYIEYPAVFLLFDVILSISRGGFSKYSGNLIIQEMFGNENI